MCTPQVDARALAQAFSKQCFGRVLAVNEVRRCGGEVVVAVAADVVVVVVVGVWCIVPDYRHAVSVCLLLRTRPNSAAAASTAAVTAPAAAVVAGFCLHSMWWWMCQAVRPCCCVWPQPTHSQLRSSRTSWGTTASGGLGWGMGVLVSSAITLIRDLERACLPQLGPCW